MANDLQTSGQVFISYRRSDAAPYAGRLYDYLAASVGEKHVFMDVDSIQPGASFTEAVEQAVTSCEVVLVLIGPNWINATDQEGRRRINDPNDYVRRAIGTALRHEIFVVPVLIDGTLFPGTQDLPAELKALAQRQALGLSSLSFRDDAERLTSLVSNVLLARTRQLQGPRTFLVPRNRIFVSYNHKDQYWLDRLQVHLRPLERQGRVELWNDHQIRAGDEWREEIKKAIRSCQAAVLLVSADFMASDFIYNDELSPLLEAGKSRGVKIIPLLVSSSYYNDSNLGRFQAINGPSEPLDMLSKGQQEAYFVKVYKAVRDSLSPDL